MERDQITRTDRYALPPPPVRPEYKYETQIGDIKVSFAGSVYSVTLPGNRGSFSACNIPFDALEANLALELRAFVAHVEAMEAEARR